MMREPILKINVKPKILFLNQMAGTLFRELAERLSEKWYPSLLCTGHPDTIRKGGTDSLHIREAPLYDKRSEFRRIWSWFRYFFTAFYQSLKSPVSTQLFISSNPPFLFAIGYLLKILRGQRYIVLVYDIYPDILVCLGRLNERGVIAWIWRSFNKAAWENAEIVFTLSKSMAKNMKSQFDPKRTTHGEIVIVPPWVDRNFIKPIPKSENWFAQKYNLANKLTLIHSGNIGATYNIEAIVELARVCRDDKRFNFLIIGDGAKRHIVENAIQLEKLNNITLLPPLPEEVLPYSLSTGDIAVVLLMPGLDGLMLPSTIPYYLASDCKVVFGSTQDYQNLLFFLRGKISLHELSAGKECESFSSPSPRTHLGENSFQKLLNAMKSIQLN
jgi:glycosyltransferase involved in cell wall biosynthesis